MVYEHKIVETFVPFWKREKEISLADASMQQLNKLSSEGWEVLSVISEFKFLLRRPINSGAV
jgi:hypothetical protein